MNLDDDDLIHYFGQDLLRRASPDSWPYPNHRLAILDGHCYLCEDGIGPLRDPLETTVYLRSGRCGPCQRDGRYSPDPPPG